MDLSLPADRLLAIVETQNEIGTAALDLDAVMTLVVRRARELLGAAAGVIEMIEGQEMVYHAASGAAEPYVGLRLKAASSLSGRCVAENEILYCEDAANDPRVDFQACLKVGAVSMLCVPLLHAGRPVGALKVYDPQPQAFDEVDVQTLSMLSGLIAAQMAHSSDYEAQRHASTHDKLTGLRNRRAFDERLASEAARVRRHAGEVTICLLDLDSFKQVNDTLGHAAGDEVLAAVAGHLEIRSEDEAYRIGGDEFALLLVEASREAAELILERIATAISQDGKCHGVGLSAGIATLTGDPIQTLAEADASLYRAKRTATSLRMST